MDVIRLTSLPEYHQSTRVVAYARVSKDKESMLHSLNAQVDYYTNLIKSNADYTFCGIYADEGISGTKVDRPEFRRLLADARSHKFDMIITKSVSRFARNLVLLLSSIRELKQLGIDVYFEEQNIHTLSYEGEIMLTIFASTAEEEARSMSLNMLWRVTKDMERGLIWGGRDPYGYCISGKRLVVKPSEAKVVKMIFDLYQSGLGDNAIAAKLDELAIKPKSGTKWNRSTIHDILTNTSYTGELLLQKYYRASLLSKTRKRNKGNVAQYLVEESHEAIVTKEQFEQCLVIRKNRSNRYKSTEGSKHYKLSGLIRCGLCGSTYTHKSSHNIPKWRCSRAKYGKSYCRNKEIPESAIFDLIDIDAIGEVDHITAYPDNRLIISYKDETSVEQNWKMPSRRNSWTLAMKEKARRRNYANSHKD